MRTCVRAAAVYQRLALLNLPSKVLLVVIQSNSAAACSACSSGGSSVLLLFDSMCAVLAAELAAVCCCFKSACVQCLQQRWRQCTVLVDGMRAALAAAVVAF